MNKFSTAIAGLLSVCFVMLFLSACAGTRPAVATSNKFQCGKYTVEESRGFVTVTDVSSVRLNSAGVIQDMSNGSIRRAYSSMEYLYLNVEKRDKTHERLLRYGGESFPCLPSSP